MPVSLRWRLVFGTLSVFRLGDPLAMRLASAGDSVGYLAWSAVECSANGVIMWYWRSRRMLLGVRMSRHYAIGWLSCGLSSKLSVSRRSRTVFRDWLVRFGNGWSDLGRGRGRIRGLGLPRDCVRGGWIVCTFSVSIDPAARRRFES